MLRADGSTGAGGGGGGGTWATGRRWKFPMIALPLGIFP